MIPQKQAEHARHAREMRTRVTASRVRMTAVQAGTHGGEEREREREREKERERESESESEG